MSEKEFNLLYEPWILVLNFRGEIEELSLIEVFERAHELKSISGELPTQDIAILRLLLAVLYGTFTKNDEFGNEGPINDVDKALERWDRLWRLGHFPISPIKKYLSAYEERFYLFHPERPFYQVAGLHEANGKQNTVAQIISDVPSRPERRFITTKSGEEAEALSFSEAARWLVSLQAWDYAGKKAAVVNGNCNGGGTGWLGKIGVIYSVSETLFETLMLNFILIKSDDSLLPYGIPIWEDNNKPVTHKVERRPAGYCELLTLQSRRVRLFRGEGKKSSLVTGVLSSYGDVFEACNIFIEQMTGWCINSHGENKGQYRPKTHEKERSLWRDLNSILPNSANVYDGRIIPGTVQWLTILKDYNLLPNKIINLCAVGFHYGNMQAKIEAMTSDMLSINSGILSKMSEEWIIRIEDVVKLSDDCVEQLSILSKDLAMASGDNDDERIKKIGSNARAEAYYRLDIPFRNWLVNINPLETDIDQAENDWKNTVKNILLKLGAEMTEQTGEKGIVGRWSKNKLYTAPGAYINFSRNIKRILEKGGE